MSDAGSFDAESARLHENAAGERDWQLWGPYLAERQWGTVREDYSSDGEAWRYFTHDDGQCHEVRYAPGVSDTDLFGGNSNWRGPIWLPLNYLLIEALKRHHHFYGKTLLVECPVGSGRELTLLGVAEELERRLSRLFLAPGAVVAPWRGVGSRLAHDPHSTGLSLFHEYFDAETGQGLGASHQTGWTALIANVIERVALSRARP